MEHRDVTSPPFTFPVVDDEARRNQQFPVRDGAQEHVARWIQGIPMNQHLAVGDGAQRSSSYRGRINQHLPVSDEGAQEHGARTWIHATPMAQQERINPQLSAWNQERERRMNLQNANQQQLLVGDGTRRLLQEKAGNQNLSIGIGSSIEEHRNQPVTPSWYQDHKTLKPTLPPCYGFNPTDEHILTRFLQPFNQNRQLTACPIHEIKDVYSMIPNILTGLFERGNDRDWFFFSGKTFPEPTSTSNRKINGGEWIKNGSTKKIMINDSFQGWKRTMEFHGDSTVAEWTMEEFTLQPKSSNHILCKLYRSEKSTRKGGLQNQNVASKSPLKKQKLSSSNPTLINPSNYFLPPEMPQLNTTGNPHLYHTQLTQSNLPNPYLHTSEDPNLYFTQLTQSNPLNPQLNFYADPTNPNHNPTNSQTQHNRSQQAADSNYTHLLQSMPLNPQLNFYADPTNPNPTDSQTQHNQSEQAAHHNCTQPTQCSLPNPQVNLHYIHPDHNHTNSEAQNSKNQNQEPHQFFQ